MACAAAAGVCSADMSDTQKRTGSAMFAHSCHLRMLASRQPRWSQRPRLETRQGARGTSTNPDEVWSNPPHQGQALDCPMPLAQFMRTLEKEGEPLRMMPAGAAALQSGQLSLVVLIHAPNTLHSSSSITKIARQRQGRATMKAFQASCRQIVYSILPKLSRQKASTLTVLLGGQLRTIENGGMLSARCSAGSRHRR